jgi:hypothetical protein
LWVAVPHLARARDRPRLLGTALVEALAERSTRGAGAGCVAVIACLAHNLGRWTAQLGRSDPTPRAARTLRRRLFALPGRLTRDARRWTLHLP